MELWALCKVCVFLHFHSNLCHVTLNPFHHFVSGVAIFGTTVAISLGCIIASRHLHLDLLNNVLHSPMSFFESTPSGNLLNRFAKEIDAIDNMIPDGLKMMLSYFFKLMEVCIIVLMATPFAAVIILPMAFIYAFIQVQLTLIIPRSTGNVAF